MNKALFFLLIIITGLVYILNIDKALSDKFTVINDFKQAYLKQMIKVSKSIDKYFYQASTIEHLKEENSLLKQYQSLYIESKTSLNNLNNANKSLLDTKHKVSLARVVSYVNFDDFTKVWLDLKKEDEKIEALVLDNYAAGIVINRSNKALALLNGNEKSNYSVYIGKNKAPGIVHKHERNSLKVKFIPIWIEVKVGDEVITSGMDNIFFEGLKVGKVVLINKMADMQEAIIKPYAKVLQKKYFYIYSHEQVEKSKVIEENTKSKTEDKTKAKVLNH